MASSRIVGVLEVDAKGKKLKLNLRRNVSPEDLVSKFLSKHKLPQKFFNPLMGKVQLMLENGTSPSGGVSLMNLLLRLSLIYYSAKKRRS
jgi:hypothetical protein